MPKFYFSFGVGYDVSDCYVVVEADTENEARERFIAEREAAGLDARRGWSSVYDEAQFNSLRRPPALEVAIDTPARGAD